MQSAARHHRRYLSHQIDSAARTVPPRSSDPGIRFANDADVHLLFEGPRQETSICFAWMLIDVDLLKEIQHRQISGSNRIINCSPKVTITTLTLALQLHAEHYSAYLRRSANPH